MDGSDRIAALLGGPVLVVVGYAMLRGGWWIEERFRLHFVGSGALLPWALMLLGLYLFGRGLLGL